MPFTTWIRDLFGIRKDYVDTEKSMLEIERLEAEKRERELITPATMDDVKNYDPKYRRIEARLRAEETSAILEQLIVRRNRRYPIILSLVVVGFALYGAIDLIIKILRSLF